MTGNRLSAGLAQISARLDQLASTNGMLAIREGLLWIIPVLLISSLLLVLSVVLPLAGVPAGISRTFADLRMALDGFTPLLISAAIGSVLALRYRLPRIPVAFLCLINLQLAATMLSGYSGLLSALIVFIALVSPIVFIRFLALLRRCKAIPKIRPVLVDENLRETINLLLPAIITTLVWIGFLALLRIPLQHLPDLNTSLPYSDHPYLSGSIVAGLNSLLWFFGIHGYHALAPFFSGLEYATLLNHADYLYEGRASHVLNLSQLASFVFIGGSGASFSLALALTLFCQNKTLRVIGATAIPLALLNVNELLLFGLPIILNPRLLVPFLLAPQINLLISLGAISSGFVSPAFIPLPLNAPMILNAYWSSGGEGSAVLLQMFLAMLGVLVYLPFVRQLELRSRGVETIEIRSLDTTFVRLQEEAILYHYDPISEASALRHEHSEEIRKIQEISELDFFLEYQPQISLEENRCIGCEALLRARTPSGETRTPQEFLQWLERVGLLCDLDIWVAAQAVRQHHEWQKQSFTMPISINITGPTLSSPEYRSKLMDILAPYGESFVVEITENLLAGDTKEVACALCELHAIGCAIAIDDFGTGYSALSYLHQFDVDKIKIDRSFIVASAEERGARVLDGLLKFGSALDLQIIAEGVENEREIRLLEREQGVVVQGWFFSRSLPPDAFRQYVISREHNAP